MGIFASRSWIVAACACGLLVGAGAVLIFTFAVFLNPVAEDLSRPALNGHAFDRFHSYSQILNGCEIVLAVTCVLLLGPGKYPFPAVKHAPQLTAN